MRRGEVERNLGPIADITAEQARRRLATMRAAFPTALVTDHQDLIPVMTKHLKDRHVLACAVRAGAALIVTANLRDFPADALDPYDMQAVHPDNFCWTSWTWTPPPPCARCAGSMSVSNDPH